VETLVDNSNRADRRRNVFDIVADLGFLDRKPLPPRSEPPPDAAPAPAPEPAAPPSLTLVKPPAPVPVEALVAAQPRAEGPHFELAQTLTEAQQRAAEQRMAAEKLLQEALELERRLADEAAQARAANEQALGQELAVAVEEARNAERDAAEHAGICTKNFERIATQKAQAEALQADDRTARRTAADDVAATEARLAEARRRLEVADAACSESDRRFNDMSAAEESARAEAATASQLLADRRAAREALEQQLNGIQERAAAFPGSVPSLARVEQLRALETRGALSNDAAARVAERRAADAAKRIAERRAADAQRGAAS
jgi:chromosome segregation ATPase